MTSENKQLGIFLDNWTTFRGFIRKEEIQAIRNLYKDDDFLKEYTYFLEINKTIIIKDILPGFFRYEKDDLFYGAFFHESLTQEEVKSYKEKMKNGCKEARFYCIGDADEGVDTYFGMPAADEELLLTSFKARGEVIFIKDEEQKNKGIFINNCSDMGIDVTLYYKDAKNNKIVVISFG